jgi:hypothetical protein
MLLRLSEVVLHILRMSHTLTIRLTADQARWLEETRRKTGLSQGQIVRQQLDKARCSADSQPFMALAGAIDGPKNLSKRKGFARS